MSTETQKVDVLAVMDDLHRGCRMYCDSEGRENRSNYADDLLVRRYDEARAAVAELIAKAEYFGHLFEAWNRADESVPAELQGTTEREVVEAMYDMRAALARVGGDV